MLQNIVGNHNVNAVVGEWHDTILDQDRIVHGSVRRYNRINVSANHLKVATFHEAGLASLFDDIILEPLCPTCADIEEAM